jgi:AraC-like DNA-binding protein
MREEWVKLDFGDEEGLFHMNRTQRFEPFERGNHVHGTYEIYYLIEGERAYFIKDRTYSSSAGDLVFIPKSEVHKSLNCSNPAHERIVINFSDRFLDVLGDACGSDLFAPFGMPSHVLRLSAVERKEVLALLERMGRELADRKPGYLNLVRLLLAELLLMAARWTPRGEAGAAAAVNTNPRHRKISEIVRHINEHYNETLSLERLAGQFYISPYHLSRAFKQVTGFTFIEYVTMTRVREAQRLLAGTGLKVIEIAAQVGYDSIAHFGRSFKQKTGMTPREYRRQAGLDVTSSPYTGPSGDPARS